MGFFCVKGLTECFFTERRFLTDFFNSAGNFFLGQNIFGSRINYYVVNIFNGTLAQCIEGADGVNHIIP